MLCASCNTEISMLFKHAFLKNECPACGRKLMDPETLKLLNDIKQTISDEINIKEESVEKIANVLFSKYIISFRDNSYVSQKNNEKIKVYKNDSDPLIQASDIMKEDISDEERDKILEEALKEKFQDISFEDGVMVDEFDPDLDGPNIDLDESIISRLTGQKTSIQAPTEKKGIFSEDEINPYLEQKRKESIKRQRENISSGNSKIKRM